MKEIKPEIKILKELLENVELSKKEKAEAIIENMIINLDENKAIQITKALASENRIKILKLIYINPRKFTELKEQLNLPSSSMVNNLNQLINAKLVKHNIKTNQYEITQFGITVLRVLALLCNITY